MAGTFRCTIVTPSSSVFDEDVRYVSFPAWDGQQGVMSGQSPLLSRLGIGSLRIDTGEATRHWFLVEGGFAQIQDGVLTILTERATPASELSAAEADAELAAANAQAVTGSVEVEIAEAAQQRARTKRSLARVHGG